MTKPTDSAKELFMNAGLKMAFRKGSVKDPDMAELMEAVRMIAVGLHDMSVGLRATYMLLEEVKGRIKS